MKLQSPVQPKKPAQILSKAAENEETQQQLVATTSHDENIEIETGELLVIGNEPEKKLDVVEEERRPTTLNMPALKQSEFREESLSEFNEPSEKKLEFSHETREAANLLDAPRESTQMVYENAIVEIKPERVSESDGEELVLAVPICNELLVADTVTETVVDTVTDRAIHVVTKSNESESCLLNAVRSEMTIEDEMSATEFYDLPSLRLERAETRQEKLSLNSKPDKTLLLWLSYPKISSHLTHLDEETTRELDEKLDELYERAGLDRTQTISEDASRHDMSRVEKILNLFMSNQESVEEFQEEIIKLLPHSRPELQQLILDRQMALEVDESCELCEQPVTYSPGTTRRFRDESSSFSEDSIEELAEALSVTAKPKQPRGSEALRAIDSTSLGQCETFTTLTNETTKKPQQTSSPIMDEFEDPTATTTANSNRFNLSLNLDDVGLVYEQIDLVPTKKEERVFTPIEIKTEMLNESQLNDESQSSAVSTTTTSSGMSDTTSGKVHLIESVEVVTHHNNNGDEDELVHVHRVDINRLKIKEKPNEAERFRVKYKQEELLDLRGDKLTEDERLDLSTNKLFAKKFVEQIIQLSSKKLGLLTDENSRLHEEDFDDEDENTVNNADLNTVSNKTTSEILESLSNLRDDLVRESKSKITTTVDDRAIAANNNTRSELFDRTVNLTATDSNEFKVSKC